MEIDIRLNPKGPRIIPDKINPTIPGIFNLLAKSGEKRKKSRIIKKTITGSLKGKFNPGIKSMAINLMLQFIHKN